MVYLIKLDSIQKKAMVEIFNNFIDTKKMEHLEPVLVKDLKKQLHDTTLEEKKKVELEKVEIAQVAVKTLQESGKIDVQYQGLDEIIETTLENAEKKILHIPPGLQKNKIKKKIEDYKKIYKELFGTEFTIQ